MCLRTKSAPQPFGPYILWPVSDEQIDLHRRDVDRNLADGLRGVDMEQARRRVRDRADLGERLHDADLVVRGHHADERRVVGVTAALSASRSITPVAADRHDRHAPALLAQPAARLRAPTCARSPTRRCAAGRIRRGRTRPAMARLFDSVAPLVKYDLARRRADERSRPRGGPARRPPAPSIPTGASTRPDFRTSR